MTGAVARLRHIGGDLSALGVGAPVRGAYEVSKRAGGHRAVFGALAALSDRGARPRSLRAAAAPGDRGSRADAARTLGAAERITSGQIAVFGREVRAEGLPDWHGTLDEPGSAWPRSPWWTIDIRSEDRRSDVKLTWELNRHRHLVVLARAAALDPGPRWIEPLRSHLVSWLDDNPPEHGVQWYSNLEIALRALAWIEVLDLVGTRLPADVVRRMEAALVHSARHLLADLPYTLSTMRNNHLLGDALALRVLAERGLTGRRAGAVGKRLFEAQLARHMHDDGSMIEDSLSYHRFVLEMLITSVQYWPDPAVTGAMVDAAQMLARLGVLEGAVPQYGDWDEGRVLVSAGAADDLRGTTRAALALGGTGAPADWAADHDEVAWHVGPGTPVVPEPAEVDGRDVGGAMARAARGPFTAWLKAGGGPSHGHADRCSTVVRWNDTWLVGDPGTGTYNGPLAERNHFRTSIAHSVLRVDGADQLVPHRAFRWRYDARGAVGAPLVVGDRSIMWGAHDAYRRIGAGRVARAVVTGTEGVTVVDWVEDGDGRGWALSLPVGPDVDVAPDGDRLIAPAGEVALDLPARPTIARGGTDPYDGWWSDTYDDARPSTRLEVTGTLDGPVAWSLGAATVVVDGDTAAVDGTTLRISWSDGRLDLEVDGRLTAYCELP